MELFVFLSNLLDIKLQLKTFSFLLATRPSDRYHGETLSNQGNAIGAKIEVGKRTITTQQPNIHIVLSPH